MTAAAQEGGVQTGRVLRLEVGISPLEGLVRKISTFTPHEIEAASLVKVYTFEFPERVPTDEEIAEICGRPFVDPITESFSVDRRLVEELGIPFDYLVDVYIRPTQVDPTGRLASEMLLRRLNWPLDTNVVGHSSEQYVIQAPQLAQADLQQIVDNHIANPLLYEANISTRGVLGQPFVAHIPRSTVTQAVTNERYDIADITEEKLAELNARLPLEATIEGMKYLDSVLRRPDVLAERKRLGLDERATETDLATWFGLRSEHCFHSDLNARIRYYDTKWRADPVISKAVQDGLLEEIEPGVLFLEKGMFKSCIQEPAMEIIQKLEKRGTNWVVNPFDDNAGIAKLTENIWYAFKVESHNSPSAKEPVQGAKTGIDGVDRDPKNVLNGFMVVYTGLFYYCVGDPAYNLWLPPKTLPTSQIFTQVIQGVREGGNESQIATNYGGCVFDPRYIAKPLIIVGRLAAGVAVRDGKLIARKEVKPGYMGLVIGNKVGFGGIGGGVESSGSRTVDTSLMHVQYDEPFMQLKAFQTMEEASELDLFEASNDFGALGVASAIGDLSKISGGVDIYLDRHERKFDRMSPWQIAVSEEQDRVAVVCKKENYPQIKRIVARHESRVDHIADFTDSGFMRQYFNGEAVSVLPIGIMFDQEPRKILEAEWRRPVYEDPDFDEPDSLVQELARVLGNINNASIEWIYRQKDSMVQGVQIIPPWIGKTTKVDADAVITTKPEWPDRIGVMMAAGIAPKYSDIDPYDSAMLAFTDMVGKAVAMGAKRPNMQVASYDPWTVNNNYFCPNLEHHPLKNKRGKQNLGECLRMALAVRECQPGYDIPVISGKDSVRCSARLEVPMDFDLEQVPLQLREHIQLYEEEGKRFIEIHDPSTLLMSAALKVEDYSKAVTQDFKQEGDLVYVIGRVGDEVAGTTYYENIGIRLRGTRFVGSKGPKVDIGRANSAFDRIEQAIEQRLLASCAYSHEGGLAKAIALGAIAGDYGVEIDWRQIQRADDVTRTGTLMFSRTSGMFVLTIDPKDKDALEALLDVTPYACIGKVTADRQFSMTRMDGHQETGSIDDLARAYKEPLGFDLTGPEPYRGQDVVVQ